MIEEGFPAGPALSDVGPEVVVEALRGPGLSFDVGGATVCLRSDSGLLASQLQRAYAAFPFARRAPWADVHVQVLRARGLRRWIRSQVEFLSDGVRRFEPFPSASALPLFEWGCNWLIGNRLNHLLLFHSGAVERNGRALLLPAVPGAGKSTLTAALSRRGWRLLSDEFGAFDPKAGVFRAILKPVALKNESIPVIRKFAPDAVFGPEFPGTRKGTVAHMAADFGSVTRRHEPAAPGGFILPRWQAGSPTRVEPLSPDNLFKALAFHAFNYEVLGEVAFRAVVNLVRACPAWQLTYSDLDDAIRTVESLWATQRLHGASQSVDTAG